MKSATTTTVSILLLCLHHSLVLYSTVFSSCAAAMMTMNNDINNNYIKNDDDASKATETTTTEDMLLFRIVRYESGQTERNKLPIFEATSYGASQLFNNNTNNNNNNNDNDKEEEEEEEEQSCSSNNISIINEKSIEIEVQEYRDGVFVIHNVLSKKECENIINLSEQMGYTLDAPVSLGRNIRHNENCVWIMDSTINQIIFDRVRNVLPQSILYREQYDLGKPIGLNRRWRLYKYTKNDIFKLHTDGPWTGSGIDNKTGKYKRDIYNGTALSWLTFLIYLNDDFDGGNTKFPINDNTNNDDDGRLLLQRDDDDEEQPYFDVQPKQGSVLCFYHGYHPLSRLHEGSIVTNGTKYVARTEVLYKMPPRIN